MDNRSEDALKARYQPLLRQRGEQLRGEIRETLLRVDQDRYALLAEDLRDSKNLSVAQMLTETGAADIRRDADELADVEQALGRLASGRYGICIDCDADIPTTRLDAYPTAKRCLPCQEKHEAARQGASTS